MAYYDILHQIYNFLHAGCYNMDIECHKFFQRIDVFSSFKIFKLKNKNVGIKCVLKNDSYIDQSYKMVCSTSDVQKILHPIFISN